MTNKGYQFLEVKIYDLKFKGCKYNWINDISSNLYDEYKTYKNYYRKAYFNDFYKELQKELKNQFKRYYKEYDINLKLDFFICATDVTATIKFNCNDKYCNTNSDIQHLKYEVNTFINDYLSNMKNNKIDYLMIC